MRAALYYGKRDVRIEDVPRPAPAPGELLLEVHAVGICGTDASEWDHGPLMTPLSARDPRSGHKGPLILGHEFGGRVVSRGPGVAGFADGTLVATGAGVSCGHCRSCRLGHTNFCDTYYTLGLQAHGGLAEFAAVPVDICLDVDELGLTSDGAALVQPMSIAMHSMRQGEPRPGDRVLVFGVGGIGAFLVHALAAAGGEVIAADLHQDRLAVASSLGAGATILIDRDEPLRTQLSDGLGGSVAVAYEVTGVAGAIEAALGLLEARGRLVAIGLGGATTPIDLRSLTLRELRIVGTNAHVFAEDLRDAAVRIGSREGGWGDVAPVALSLEELVDSGLRPMAEGEGDRIKTLIDPFATATRPTVTSMSQAGNDHI